MADNNIRKSIKTKTTDGSHSAATEDTRDIFEKALDYAPAAGAIGAAIVGRSVGRRAGKRAIDEARATGRFHGDEDIAEAARSPNAARRYIRESGQGGAIAFGAIGAAPAIGYYGAKSTDKKRRK